MDLSILAKTVANLAPLLGSVLPIPGGAVIGELIAHEFGGSTTDPNQLASIIATDPNAQVKLAEIQANTKIQLQQLLVQNAQNELVAQTAQIQNDQLDRADARKNGQNSIMPSIVTFIIIIGFFGCFGVLLMYGTNNPDSQVLYMMVGTLSTAFGGAVTFWLGSSASSRSKDVAIHNTLANLSANN
jgi:hypothetical protein